MAVVFSWKVAPGKYSYLIPDGNGSYIRSRVTDPQDLHDMADEVSNWSEDDYRDAFNAMKAEVGGIYKSFEDKEYSDYYTISGITDGTVVLLSGKDGGDGLDGESDGGNDPFLDEKDYKELERKIREEFDKYKNSILAQVEEIRNAIENMASTSIGDALSQLSETREMLANLRAQMEAAAATAQNALDAARSLANMGGDITPEMLESILGMKQEVGEWMDRFDGKIQKIITDYDKATQDLGLIGYGADPARGVFSFMAENINTLNGTVGTAGSEWNASGGMVKDFGTWFDESDNSYAEVVRLINAKRAEIQDVIDYINGSSTTRISQKLNAQIGEMLSELDYSGGEGTSHVEQKLNVLSGVVATSIARYDALSGRVVSINNSMNGMEATVEQAMTIANMASGTAKDLRQLWSEQSGIMQTVANLTVRTDENGDAIYWYIDPELDDPDDETRWVRVYYMGNNPSTNLPYYNTRKDGSGTQYEKNVFPDYLAGMASYILQNAGEVTINVSSGDVISSLRLTVTEDGESIIYGLADKVLLDSHVIASSLTATAANIGGVHIGAGMISAQTGDNKWALRGDGILEATGAEISGHIFATSLTLADGITPDVDGMVTVNHWVGDEDGETGFMVSSEGLLQAKNAIIQGTVAASDILLDGKSLKLFGDDTANTFTIGDNEIEVKHVPETVSLVGPVHYPSYDMVISGVVSVMFTVTGDTTVYLPQLKFTTSTYMSNEYLTSVNNSLSVTASVISGLTNIESPFEGDNFPYDSCITYGTGLTSFNLDQYNRSRIGYLYVGFDSRNSTSLPVKCANGQSYMALYKYVFTGDTGCERALTADTVSFVNSPDPEDIKFFNIGKNGLQIFLGDGFYFTAARDRIKGPIIAMGGKIKNGSNRGQMVGLKIDGDGISILNGTPGKGWRTPFDD